MTSDEIEKRTCQCMRVRLENFDSSFEISNVTGKFSELPDMITCTCNAGHRYSRNYGRYKSSPGMLRDLVCLD